MDNGMMLIGNQISILLAAAASSVALSAAAADKSRRLMGAGLAFLALSSGLGLFITPLREVTPVLTGMLGLYLILVTLPALFNLTGKVSIKAFFWIAILSATGALFTLTSIPDLFQEVTASVYFVLLIALLVVISIGVSFKRSYFRTQLLLLIPLAALFIRHFGNDTLLASSAEYAIALYALITISTLSSDNKNKFESITEDLHRLQNQFEEEVDKGVKMRTFHIERIKDKMAEVNRIDHLTKALNRKAIMSELDGMTANKSIQKFVMLLFDIDKFKGINDTLGHAVGDECLKTLAGIAMNSIRDVDFLGRYGGDEFIILLPNLALKDGLIVAERFRAKVAETLDPNFTISVGAAAYPWDGQNFKNLLASADKGLYTAKERGRNNVAYSGYIKLGADGSMNTSDPLL